jgi:dynein heavy chain
MPLITDLRNDAMRPRHWDKLKLELKTEVLDPENDKFTLNTVFDLGLHQYSESIAIISDDARQELSIENSLSNIKTAWNSLELEMTDYKAD